MMAWLTVNLVLEARYCRGIMHFRCATHPHAWNDKSIADLLPQQSRLLCCAHHCSADRM